jgi:PIN domain nuclease of toxin-antitoxin system
VKILLDTHILLWWLAGGTDLSAVQRKTLGREEAAGRPLAISAITLWEIAKLHELGKIRLAQTVDVVMDEIESHAQLTVLPLDGRIAVESTRLGAAFHSDPADQLIVATARVHGLHLATADERIRGSGVIAVV